MATVIGVRFSPGGKLYYFDPGSVDPAPGTQVIVPAQGGPAVAQVFLSRRDVLQPPPNLQAILRVATPDDLDRIARNRGQEREALAYARVIADELGLPVKLTACEFSFDGSRLIVSYHATERQEVPGLAERLEEIFDTRVELRQVGDRDMARLLGDLGLCGRTLCCRTWLTEFPPVTIRMAKNQDLPLNPQKISGACGRLLCCLAYEDAQYTEVRSRMPKVGTQVQTARGPGVIRETSVVRESVLVFHDDTGELEEVPLERLGQGRD